jgi:hypothetical protein
MSEIIGKTGSVRLVESAQASWRAASPRARAMSSERLFAPSVRILVVILCFSFWCAAIHFAVALARGAG